MPIVNGSGEGGGNGSVFWSIENRNGKPKYAPGKQHPGKGEVVVDDRVEGHEEVPFEQIGGGDECFTVRLRFRYQDSAKIPARTQQILDQFGVEDPRSQSWFLEVEVPAIKRVQPTGDRPWPDMPWEIVWGW
jgi:hypothetical protein